MSEMTVTTASQQYLVDGVQLRERKFVPKWLGDFVLWVFFHRCDTSTSVVITI